MLSALLVSALPRLSAIFRPSPCRLKGPDYEFNALGTEANHRYASQAIIDDAPDYRALRREILRIDWDETVPAVEAAPAPEAPAAAGAAS